MSSKYIPGDQVRSKAYGTVYSVLGTARDLMGMDVDDLMVICDSTDPKATMTLRDEKWLDWCDRVEGEQR